MVSGRPASTICKSNAKYLCSECGATEFIQAHHQIPDDDSSLVCLCATCHSKKHPDIALGLFYAKQTQPYWENISASSLSKQLGCHPRTIIRRANKLGIPKGVLSVKSRTRLLKKTREYPIRERTDMVCVICDEIPVVKFGKIPTRRGLRQRFRCQKCGSTFYKKGE